MSSVVSKLTKKHRKVDIIRLGDRAKQRAQARRARRTREVMNKGDDDGLDGDATQEGQVMVQVPVDSRESVSNVVEASAKSSSTDHELPEDGSDPEAHAPFDLSLPPSPKGSSDVVTAFRSNAVPTAGSSGGGSQGEQNASRTSLFRHVRTARRLRSGGNGPRTHNSNGIVSRPRGMSDLFEETLELGECEQVNL